MQFFDIIIIAIGLAMDASAVSLAAAAAGFANDKRAIFRLSFHFGLFQFLMPVIGWFLGISLFGYLKSFDHWIAFGLLAFVGGRMILAGLNPDEETSKKDPSRGASLVMLSIATSIDALAIGLSFAMLSVRIWYPSAIIGIVTVLLSLLAINIGKKLGTLLGKRMEVCGGVILVLIGIRILISHLTA